MSEKASQQMWAIKSRGGWLSHISCRRTDAIKQFLGPNPNSTWNYWRRKYGMRAVKVEIREL